MMYDYHATITEVIDGDTIRLDTDLGFHTTVRESYRLFGINAAEHGTPAGDAATAWLRTLLPVGSSVTVQAQKASTAIGTEKYGRWLAVIVQPGNPVTVNDQLVAAGHAKPWDGKGARPV